MEEENKNIEEIENTDDIEKVETPDESEKTEEPEKPEDSEEKIEEEESTVSIEDSILNSIKKLLGLTSSCTDFDTDIIIHINTVLMNLSQLGINVLKGFTVKDTTQVWSELIQDEDLVESIKTYMYLKVKMVFDPPLSSSVMEANAETIKELEWRLTVQVDENNLKEEV